MNDLFQSTTPLVAGGPDWLTLPVAILAGAALLAILILWWAFASMARRATIRRQLAEYHASLEAEEAAPPARPITPPPPPAPAPEPAPEPEPEIASIPEPEPDAAPEPIAEAPADPIAAEPVPEGEPIAEPAVEIAPEPVAEAAPEPVAPAEPVAAPAEPEPAPLPEPVVAPPVEEPAPVAEVSAPEPVAEVAEPVTIAPIPDPVSEPAPAAAPVADDLTRMKGVGPRLAERLNNVGIHNFAQIAALSPEDQEALDSRLGDFQGRIHRDRWVEQAGYLAAGDIAGFEEKFGKL